ncbi:MAG TPA: Gfo/Idh/MocA family oxidoreductase [Planctomycetota bacterium]|nr:Gfo/Idh/MocA family oxidoreductase [Planctomycetota bacterium]
MKQQVPSRRDLMKGAVAAGAAFGAFTILGATAKGQGKSLKVGLIGCGGRGRGALAQHLQAAKILNDKLNLGLDMKVVATADWFKDRAVATGKKHGVPDDACFGGADAYKKLIAAGPDIVLMAQAPCFRPPHFEAAVAAGKHCFIEKPIAVDPPGCRRVLAAGKAAEAKNLVVVAGTNMRHEKAAIDTHQAVTVEAALGKIVAGRAFFCIGHMFAKQPIKPQTADDLVRTWQSWIELSGDHLVEQHVHNIDMVTWFLGRPAVSAGGFGGRARRPAGNMFDFFSLDLDYGDGVFVHSMCRQVNGCWNSVGQELTCEKGTTKCTDGLKPQKSPVPDDLPCDLDGKPIPGHLQEHVNLLYHLAKGKPLNQTQDVAWATAITVMGRIAAYTGKRVTWAEMMVDPKKSPEIYDLTLKPTADDFEKGAVEVPDEGDIPAPGGATAPRPPRKGARKGRK